MVKRSVGGSVAKTGQKWPKMARSGQKWPEVARNGQIWPEIGHWWSLEVIRGHWRSTQINPRPVQIIKEALWMDGIGMGLVIIGHR